MKEWEEKLVELYDARDDAKNDMDTRAVVRQQLGGAYEARDQAYEDYHSSFLDDSARLQRQHDAVQLIVRRVAESIAGCE
eukprot:758566-Hanusia_phi.AAC.2